MMDAGGLALTAGAACSAAAAAAHLACIAVGGRAYRFMGAGERMARAAEAGRPTPTLVTLAIAGVLLMWAAYALSGAGVLMPLPWTGVALALISTVYLVRAVAFPFLRPAFPDNSPTFWWVSSSLCGVMGLMHAYGTWRWWLAS